MLWFRSKTLVVNSYLKIFSTKFLHKYPFPGFCFKFESHHSQKKTFCWKYAVKKLGQLSHTKTTPTPGQLPPGQFYTCNHCACFIPEKEQITSLFTKNIQRAF